MRRLDLVGQRFGRLVVTKFAAVVNGHTTWHCQCDCGEKIIKQGCHMKSGETQSCGCWRIERTGLNLKVHGEAHGNANSGLRPATPEYVVWTNMKARCCNPRNKDFKDYGGRGIRVCQRWLNSYPAFLADMGRRPSSQHSIDRIDNDGDYTPENCQWATLDQQNSNRRNCK